MERIVTDSASGTAPVFSFLSQARSCFVGHLISAYGFLVCLLRHETQRQDER